MRIFLAGASGAIGRRLTPLLIAAGHEVTGTTRSVDKVQELAAGGVDAVVVDVFNAGAVRDAVVRARPEIVIHQLTDCRKSLIRRCYAMRFRAIPGCGSKVPPIWSRQPKQRALAA
jgi:uncharacterized protein YbjT (DUF2867 family)